ncbi:hypothetical protein C3L33_09102, partial [Rhododendron williamsianum]
MGPSSSNTTNGASSNNFVKIDVITLSGEESSGSDGIDSIEEKTQSGEESSGSDGILKQRRIEKVQLILRSDKRNKGCYDPKVVSVGPYHHGKKELQEAENLKPRVAEMLVSRCSHNMDKFLQKVLEKADDARSCYVDGSTDKYSKEKFAEMMLLDACFVLAFIEAPVDQDLRILHEIVTCLGMQALLASGTDIFNLLENQIPFFVLETVMSLKYQGEWMDVLDMFCDKLMSFGVEDYTKNAKASEISKSKGIHVRPSGVHSRKAVEFTSFFFFGLLKLPPLFFTPEWIIRCSNFVAYELGLGLNDRDNLPTMAYVNFMKSLINRPDGVKELRSKSILFTTFSSDEQVVDISMVSSLPRGL